MHLKRGTRFGLAMACVLALTGVIGTVLQAQVSEADKKKRDAFLKAREEMHTVASPAPNDSPAKGGKPKVSKKAKAKKGAAHPDSPKAKSSATDDEGDEATPAVKKKKDLSSTPTAKPKKKSDEDEDETSRRAPVVRQTPEEESRSARTIPLPATTPTAVPAVSAPPADITVQKSGFEQEQGFEPPPPPPPRRSFWSRVFGGGDGSSASYRYLSRSVIDAIRRAPVQRSRWKFIIVHNSGTRQGNARAFDYYHRRVRRMQNGLAYHFVVGNGTSSGNGEVEIGDRWRRQINGGHVHSDYLNNISLGICLVGDFNRDKPSKGQLEAVEELIKYLRERCGKADGRSIPVRPHREMNPPQWSTDCPGDAFPYSWFRRF